jgi:hypothetical protein
VALFLVIVWMGLPRTYGLSAGGDFDARGLSNLLSTRMRAAKPRSGERQSLPRALVSADQRRRRPVPVITSMRRMSAALGSSVWSSI